jgi:hypothetical protein
MRRVVDEVHLSLQKSDPIVQLCCDRESLVRSSVAGFYEGGIVSGDFGDVAVFSGAEFWVVVAGCCVCCFGRGGG